MLWAQESIREKDKFAEGKAKVRKKEVQVSTEEKFEEVNLSDDR